MYRKANNNGGVVLRGASSGEVLNNVPAVTEPDSFVFGSTVVLDVNTKSVLPLGNFAYNNKKPIMKGFTTEINGNSFSSSAAAVNSTGNADTSLTSSIHPISFVRTRLEHRAMESGHYNYFTGKYDAGYPDVQRDSLGLDIAANPSRSNPGKILFAYSKRLISTNYHSKNG